MVGLSCKNTMRKQISTRGVCGHQSHDSTLCGCRDIEGEEEGSAPAASKRTPTGATTEELTRKVEELIEMPIITTSTELVVARLSIVSTPTIDKLGHLRPPGNYRNL